MTFVFGTWPPVDDSGGGGGAPVYLALVSSDGSVPLATPDFIDSFSHTPATGVYDFVLTAALSAQIAGPLGQPQFVVQSVGDDADAIATAVQTTTGLPQFTVQITFADNAEHTFTWGLIFGNPPLLLPT